MDPLILSVDQIRSIDRLAIERYQMPGEILMENAGRGAAELILTNYAADRPTTAAIFAGSGNNGGDGFVIARHLHNAGLQVRIGLVGSPEKLRNEAAVNYRIVRHMHLPIFSCVDPASSLNKAEQATAGANIIIDALLGTGFAGQVRQPLAAVIEHINAANLPVIAIDVPSGLDAQSGQPAQTTIQAQMTITFVAIKPGFLQPAARKFIGRLHVVDIGVPRELIDQVAQQGQT